MQNQIFDSLVARLGEHFGTGRPLDNGTGVRFQSVRRGKLTIYHADLATGNQAEVAFEPVSMARRLSISEGEIRALVAEFRARTGRDVWPDPQFNWPRVGFADAAHVEAIVTAIEHSLGAAR